MPDYIPASATRDALLALVALALLAAPLWTPLLHLSGPTYHYEGAEVVTDGDGIAYADDSMNGLSGLPISNDIACSDQFDIRPCALEGLVASGATVPTNWYSGSQNSTGSPAPSGNERYRYAMVNDTVYETTYVVNGSAQNDNGSYRIYLALEPAEPGEVLRSVSVGEPHEEVPDVVEEAARRGSANAPAAVDVPETPVRLEDDDGTDTYYRVYSNGSTDDTTPLLWAIDRLLTYAAPLVGLALLTGVWSRLEVTYVGGED
ncbi:hypothetical protein [Halomontanus rarus]|uniref:hypothetical protein n=1 Tax=Halomontanus rarus TaxID=3034020 RepID=UPI001A98CF37